jgi:hypothetical protein
MNMNTDLNNEYMLLFRGDDWDRGLPPEALQRVMDQVMAWFDGLQGQGKVKAGQPLARKGKIISAQKGKVIADGPFAESKEAIGGYLLLRTVDFAEAVTIAKTCPTLHHGVSIEVRPVLDECPVFKRIREQQIFVTA